MYDNIIIERYCRKTYILQTVIVVLIFLLCVKKGKKPNGRKRQCRKIKNKTTCFSFLSQVQSILSVMYNINTCTIKSSFRRVLCHRHASFVIAHLPSRTWFTRRLLSRRSTYDQRTVSNNVIFFIVVIIIVVISILYRYSFVKYVKCCDVAVAAIESCIPIYLFQLYLYA